MIRKTKPPREVQHLDDSCWAAVLVSWSQAESKIPVQKQKDLYTKWGEGKTGKITPEKKLPMLAKHYDLVWGGYKSNELSTYIERHLNKSYLFVAYKQDSKNHHAVLVYYLDKDNIEYMDPYKGEYIKQKRSWIEQRGPFGVLRLP